MRKKFSSRDDALRAIGKAGLEETAIIAKEKSSNGNGKAKAATIKKAKTAKAKTPRPKSDIQRRTISSEEDEVAAKFQVLKDSKQHKVLKKLLAAEGEPVAMKDLAKTAGVEVSAAAMIVHGITRKTKGELLHGKPRPKYKVVRSKVEKEVHIALQAE